jgi:SAM-dependent methyltransferase
MSTMAAADTNRNRIVFERRSVVAGYASSAALSAGEARLLARYQAWIAGGRVLDLGVGAGRTAPYLAGIAAEYVGIDFSRRMVEACRARFPEWRFQQGDARDLSAFRDGSLDFVLFSFNGIDCVDHADRLRIIREVARVLRTGGVFVFSSHNLAAAPAGGFYRHLFRVPPATNPVRAAKSAVRIASRLVNYARHARGQVRNADYAILVDPAHEFAMAHYYVTEAAQKRQLVAAGFLPEIDVEADTEDAAPYYLYYAARKGGDC